MVPSAVAMMVATTPMMMLLPNAPQTSWASHTFSHLSNVNPRQTIFDFSESLNEKMNV